MKNNEGYRNQSTFCSGSEQKLADLKTELFNLRFQHAVNQLDNPLRLVEVKKDIARVKTVLKEKELETK